MASVLVIDGNNQLRELLRFALEAKGHEVSDANDGAIGVQRYRENPTELVVTDLEMPVQGGIETIMQLRSANPQVRILGISGAFSRDGASAFLAGRHGADAWLSKPFTMIEFVRTVANLLANRPGT